MRLQGRRGAVAIPEINAKCQFHNHQHELSLVKEDDCEEEDDDDDDDYPDRELMIPVCDGCTTPIYKSSMYYSCGECKYFLHLECFHKPAELPSHPWPHDYDHLLGSISLMLRSYPNTYLSSFCRICEYDTNALLYASTRGGLKIDIKCASLPSTIKHAAHPQHYLHQFWYVRDHKCEACGNECDSFAYYCRSCGFTLHYQCALLPLSTKHRWDKHPLPLTYDANINHPSEFYCEICEEEMNPKSWMYHCRQCDQSFHPKCLPTTGPNRHTKFGQQHFISSCHRRDHPLTHVQVSIKLRCDLCHTDVYGHRGLECASCNFVMCLSCAQEPKDAIGTTENNGDS